MTNAASDLNALVIRWREVRRDHLGYQPLFNPEAHHFEGSVATYSGRSSECAEAGAQAICLTGRELGLNRGMSGAP